MKALSTRLIFGFVIVLVVVTGVVLAIRQSPKADEATPESEINELSSLQPSTIWGKVTYVDGTPATAVTVTIGGVGQATNDKGEYAISVYASGSQPVTFQATGQEAIVVNDPTQSEVTVTANTSIHRDFVVRKVQL